MFSRPVAGVPTLLSRSVALLTALSAVLAAGASAQPQTFTVNTTNDLDDGTCTVGHCSLREAITAANAVPEALIAFSIPGAGPHTIRPLSQLPGIVGPLTIDGTTEPDFGGIPVVELDGSLAGMAHGLSVVGSGNTIRGLVVNRFQINGISLESGTSGALVEGCFVGTDATGTFALGNGNAGILVGQSADNIIGGPSPSQRNVISGNVEGVTIVDPTATRNAVIGNYIGTDVTGTAPVPNGVGVLLLAPLNSVGGDGPGEGNVISGNQLHGVDLGPPHATNNVVLGNFIGTDATGALALGNDVGVWVNDVADNTIGGLTAGSRNVISGNREGVTLWEAGATMTHVIGNYVGTDASGTAAIPNELGVVVYGPANTVGGWTPGAGNLVSGNLRDGITVSGLLAAGNLVQGNFVGTDAAGTSAIPNGDAGIFVLDAVGTLVGGPQAGAGNLVSGNGGVAGIFILGAGSSANLVQGNRVGVSVDGIQSLPNVGVGINLDGATGTRVGGAGAHEGNLASGNGTWGVHIWAGTDNVLEGNRIGLTADGQSALPNGEGGVFIQDSPSNFIGSAAAGARNVISGNVGSGIMIVGDPSIGNLIQNNYIGTNVSGDAAVPNGTGILLFASDTEIGGAAPNEGNLISGNTHFGIDVAQGRSGTIVEGNRIGTDGAGVLALKNDIGIWLNRAPDNRIGGSTPGAGNLISGNTLGLQIGGDGAVGNVVVGNHIGLDASGSALGNASQGILLFDGARDNRIGGTEAGEGNVIAHNGSDGIRITEATSVGNTIRGNAIRDNAGLGIDLEGVDGVDANDVGDVDTGPNDLLNHPVVMAVPTTGGQVIAKALMFDGLRNEAYTFEFFENEGCRTDAHREGRVPLFTTQITSDGSGDASIAGITDATVTHLTATATDSRGSTSEFSACVFVTDFSLQILPGGQTVPAGQAATYQVTVRTQGGAFTDAVELECTGGPAGSTCTFAESELIPGDDEASTTMTVTTAATLRASAWGPVGWGLVLLIGLARFVVPGGRRRRSAVLALVGLCLLSPLACGDDGTGPDEPTPITHQMRVTGEWEGITHSEGFALTVQ